MIVLPAIDNRLGSNDSMSDIANFQEEKKTHWQSYETRDNKELSELQKQEFFTSIDPLINRVKNAEFDRRNFLKLMGATSAMFTLNCLQKPVEKIIPYVKIPDTVKPGTPSYYASTCGGCSAACGILVKTREGRPIKIEGNQKNPISKGAICAFGQASILDLYDPDRSREPASIQKGSEKKTTWAELDKAVIEKIAQNKGKTRILTGPINSPSTRAIISEFLSSSGGGKHYEFDATSPQTAIALASEESYGKAVVPNYHFDKAKVVLSIDADFLGTWISPVEYTKQFASKRKLSESSKEIIKLYVAESFPSVTGSNADVNARFSIKAGDSRRFAMAVAAAIVSLGGKDNGGTSGYSLDSLSKELGIDPKKIEKIASDLWSARGESLVVAGGTSAQTIDAVDLQILVNLINSMLENNGKTIDHSANKSETASDYYKNIEILKKELQSGDVGVLLVYNTNPAYYLPNENWADLFAKAALYISMADRLDESSKYASFIAPSTHYLESWGDREPVKGKINIIQPTIRPIFNSRAFEDSLIVWAGGKLGGAASAYEFIKAVYMKKATKDPLLFWEDALRRGGFSSESESSDKSALNFKGSISKLPERTNGITLALYTGVSLRNGDGANNPVRQELPDPITKVTWDNFVAISPVLAKEKEIQSGDVVKVKVGNKDITLPAQIQPSLHKDTIGIALGYGRASAGKVANGVGKNSYSLGNLINGKLQLSGMKVDSIEKVGKTSRLASTQDHHMMNPTKEFGKAPKGGLFKPYDKERALIQSASFEDYLKNPESGKAESEIPKITSKGEKAKGLNPEHEYKGYKWGMSIDLSQCTGCAACVIACQIENNIPVVGKDEVLVGREMHWIRIDRYYIGDPEKPETMEIAHQPVMCQHCDSAPCETVCPVAATVHSSEGLNDMSYNRCIGTRYCSNNCPYKVRRFNWMLHWKERDYQRAPRHMALNPEVTVRTRGVMEKCTFCNSRIAEKRILAKNEGRTIKDGELKTACQQTCPADAITFGNTNDIESNVSKNARDGRAYKILDFLNVGPQVSYLTRVRNKV